MKIKTMFFLLFYVVIGILGINRITYSQTLHAIIFAGTHDESKILKEGILKTANELEIELRNVARLLKIDQSIYLFEGDHFNYNNLQKSLSSLNPGHNDIVFFYYIGHGINKPQIDNKWPQLAFPEMIPGAATRLVPFKEIVSKLESKSKRLLIAIAEACNDTEGRIDYYPEEILGMASLSLNIRDTERIKDLYLRSEGSVVCSSSEAGQTSIVSAYSGGYFGSSFLELHKEMTSISGIADWNTLLEKTRLRTQSLVELKKPGHKQLPQFIVNVRGSRKPDFAWNNHINNQHNFYEQQPQNFRFQNNYINPMPFPVAKVVFFGNPQRVYFLMSDNYITQYNPYYGLQVVGYRTVPGYPQMFQWDIISYYNPVNFLQWGVDYYGRIMDWNPAAGWQLVGIVYY
jgi:hypothetical protein